MNNSEEALAKRIAQRLVQKKAEQAKAEQLKKGTKREREGDRDNEGRFAGAKKKKDSSASDAIKAINNIYADSSKIPEKLKHALASRVCKSYGWEIEESAFSGAANDAAASEEKKTPEEPPQEQIQGQLQGQQQQQQQTDHTQFTEEELDQALVNIF